MADPALSIWPIEGLPRFKPDDALAEIILDGLKANALRPKTGDIIVLAQKIVSKAEGRIADLAKVSPSPRALELAAVTGKDPRLVELVLSESNEVLRAKKNVLVVEHRLGLVMANAGIDQSNVETDLCAEPALLLPLDPDGSAARLKVDFDRALGLSLGVVISDSFGRAWRLGTTGVAIGAAGIASLIDQRGDTDMNGRVLQVTETAFADSVASAAVLVLGEAAEATPAALVRISSRGASHRPAQSLIRPRSEDMFR